MGEFDFIATYLAPLAGREGLGLLDDAAIWSTPSGFDQVCSLDTMVEGVHFPTGQFNADLARKLIRVNLSDLTAKGADVRGYFLSLTLPDWVAEPHLKDFCVGLAQDQKQYGFKVWGGDTTSTKGPIVLSITMIGQIPTAQSVLRNGAQIGDLIGVTGYIGQSGLGLSALLGEAGGIKVDPKRLGAHMDAWISRYTLPDPPYNFRAAHRAYATAGLDISDGLLADAAHLAQASRVKLEINLHDIPHTEGALEWIEGQSNLQKARLALASCGDDYQILMTIRPQDLKSVQKEALVANTNFTPIGTVKSWQQNEPFLTCRGEDGNLIELNRLGYRHF